VFCLLALLRSRNASFLYLSYILMIAFAVIVPSAMIADFVRYRLVVDSIFIIGFAVGVSEVYGFLRHLFQKLMGVTARQLY
jgi:hypothetical protein